MPTRSAHVPNSVRTVASDFSSAGVSHNRKRERLETIEENIEKVIENLDYCFLLLVGSGLWFSLNSLLAGYLWVPVLRNFCGLGVSHWIFSLFFQGGIY